MTAKNTRLRTRGALLSHIVAGGGVFAAALFLALSGDETPRLTSRPGEFGVREDRGARRQWEFMRQRDPATGGIPDGIRAAELKFARELPTREQMAAILHKGAPVDDAHAATWNGRGPYNVGGRTRALAVDVTDPTVMLAGGVSGGVWRSEDGGLSWTKVTTASQLHSVTCIIQDTRPGRTMVWYYGTGELTGNSASAPGAPFRGDGIFKSTDGGINWFALPSTQTGTPHTFDQMFDYVWNIALDLSSQQDELYAATIGGIHRSTDGGGSWTVVRGGFANSNPRFTDVAVTSAGVLYATLSEATIAGGSGASARGIWRSTDGVSWTQIRPAAWPSSYRRLVLGIAPSDERIVYILGETPGAGFRTVFAGSEEWTSLWRYQYLSGDGSGTGGSWDNLSANIPSYGGEVGDFSPQGSYNMIVRVKPDAPDVVFIGGTNLYRSTDGFRTSAATAWIGGYSPSNNVDQYPGHHCDQHALVFAPGDPSKVYSGHDGGVSVTSDILAPSVVWTSLNRGYTTTQFYTIALDRSAAGDNTLIGGMQDNGTWMTFTGGATSVWSEVVGGDGGYCAIAPGRSSYYISFQNGQTYRVLVNGSGGLTNYARVDPVGGGGYLFINPFVLDPNFSSVMYLAGGPSLWRNGNLLAIPLRSVSASADNPTSVNWTNMAASAVPGGTISAFGISTANPPYRLYYGTDDGRVYRLDNAVTVSSQTPPVDVWSGRGFPGGAYVSSIAVDPLDGNAAMVTFSNYGVVSIFFTSNGGASWVPVAGNLESSADGSGPGPSVRWAAVYNGGTSRVWLAGTSVGLYSTAELNGPATVWALEGGSTIGRVVVDMIDIRQADAHAVVATHGFGVFSGTVTGNGPPPPPPDVPVMAELKQNFPNPFNGGTTIRYYTTDPGKVTLDMYDVSGRLVDVLVDEDRPAGQQPDVFWVPKNLAAGVYLYRLRSPGFNDTRKLLYVK